MTYGDSHKSDPIDRPDTDEYPDFDNIGYNVERDLSKGYLFNTSIDDVAAILGLLHRAIPMLVTLGNSIGNGPINLDRPGSLGERCDLIGDIKGVVGR